MGPIRFQSQDVGTKINALVQTWGDGLKKVSYIRAGRKGIAKEFNTDCSRFGRSSAENPVSWDGLKSNDQ
jgi:hypothetical protein